MVVARVFPAVNLASVFLWSRLVDTHARAMLNFCGHKNSSIYVALPSVGALLLLDALAGCRRSVRSALLCIVALLQYLISYSATSIAKLFVLAALMAVVQFRGVRPFMSGLSRLGTCGILSLFIMVWPVREGFFSPLIEGLQGKTLTFAGAHLYLGQRAGPYGRQAPAGRIRFLDSVQHRGTGYSVQRPLPTASSCICG